ncbi:glycosyltransferase family 39 protein [Flagellimonas pelagia]|uniref:4-amino-4-deoxy-L-arabinose transferase n=1 Tax=Flagellimonas pelagia TaxID=2306998 RepID=A0A3A1NJA5_9FLAO|nr:glycosyltransferase family 39 protein [Allomuricauda maritima]RIV44110.1 4-amino-4-deoxy-L-arabinose transferase [Allomuricauda maritima]TXJ94019.1 4-amino-4-deoxy-L-arabinose transferase [Allomuricauda maritima]
MSQKFPKLFLVLLAILFVLNLIQASVTELIYDEAYYWYYAQNMAWGYFDHPPMVAFLIKLSSFLFDGELGVRFMSCVLSVGTYVILWDLIDNPKKKDYVVHFFLLVFSFTLMNAYGFLTLPDTPLLFFTALFLWLYKRFLKDTSLPTTLLLGLVMAALMYSKYHAVLVILFVFLSNIKLIANKKAWLAVVLALVCYIPHFVWLYQNDFVSITFHLYERPNQAYSFDGFTLGYFLNLIVIIGLLFYWVYGALFKFRTTDKFSKALVYLVYGIIIFFFISSFNRRVQAQWAIAITIPLVVIAFNYMLDNAKSRKWMYRIGLFSLILLLYARVWLVYQPLFPVLYETHGNKEWVNELHEKAGDVPVVFENSYRRAPMYEFYSGIPAISLNNFMYRKNQYSIDGSEEKVRGKKVLYVTKYRNSGDISYMHLDSTIFHGTFIENFQSYRNIKCFVDKSETGTAYGLKVYNPYPFDIPLEQLKYTISYSNAYKQVEQMLPLKVKAEEFQGALLKSKDTLYYSFELPLTKMENPVYFRIGISENGLPPGLNGQPFKIRE